MQAAIEVSKTNTVEVFQIKDNYTRGVQAIRDVWAIVKNGHMKIQ